MADSKKSKLISNQEDIVGDIKLDEIKNATNQIYNTGLVIKTPVFNNFLIPNGKYVNLKLENLQNTGSFKIRGMVNVFRNYEKLIKEKGAITLSAGNAGKSFAYLCQKMNIKSTVFMPETVPVERIKMIENYGSSVKLVSNKNLMDSVNEQIKKNGCKLIHPFDDKDLIIGHGSLGLEILENNPDCDCIIVGCGGGGLVSGIALAVKLSGSKAKIYAVEPEGACSMHKSLDISRPSQYPRDFNINTIAHGLSPPYTGNITFEICKKYLDGVLLVTDDQLCEATKQLYDNGIVCETSGAASTAAVMQNKIPENQNNIVCILTGRNISCREMHQIQDKSFIEKN